MGCPIVNFSSNSSDFVKIRFENGCLSCKSTKKMNPTSADLPNQDGLIHTEKFYIESEKKRLFYSTDIRIIESRPKR